MEVFASIWEARRALDERRRNGRSIGFVPTMGALHAGHVSLIRAARDRCDDVVVSIFVNPTQFGPNEDYDQYPRPIDNDLKICEEHGVDVVFAPTAAAMYPDGLKTGVHVAGLTDHLCGVARPGHFDGVTTIVAKLFNVVNPDSAYFGEKDYQQLKVIERMVRDLDMPVRIVPCPTVREPDGLAVSSRNVRLTPQQRTQAVSLFRALRVAADGVRHGTTDALRLIDEITADLRRAEPTRIDYVAVVDPVTLQPLDEIRGIARACLAVVFGSTRLIDNVELDATASAS